MSKSKKGTTGAGADFTGELRDALGATLRAYGDALTGRGEKNEHIPKLLPKITFAAGALAQCVERGFFSHDDARAIVSGRIYDSATGHALAQKAIVKMMGTLRALAGDAPDAGDVSNLHGVYCVTLAQGQSVPNQRMIAHVCNGAGVAPSTGDTQSSSSARALHALGIIDSLPVDGQGRVTMHILGSSPAAGAFGTLYAGASLALFPKGRRA